jgi:hypothetical protein
MPGQCKTVLISFLVSSSHALALPVCIRCQPVLHQFSIFAPSRGCSMTPGPSHRKGRGKDNDFCKLQATETRTANRSPVTLQMRSRNRVLPITIRCWYSVPPLQCHNRQAVRTGRPDGEHRTSTNVLIGSALAWPKMCVQPSTRPWRDDWFTGCQTILLCIWFDRFDIAPLYN